MSDKKRHNHSAKEVADYLILNPKFFKEDPEVLNSIEIVHDSGADVSLIQRQIELLRTDYNSTTHKVMELLANAKNNDDIFILTKKLILDLIDASNIEEITALLEKRFKNAFGIMIDDIGAALYAILTTNIFFALLVFYTAESFST